MMRNGLLGFRLDVWGGAREGVGGENGEVLIRERVYRVTSKTGEID